MNCKTAQTQNLTDIEAATKDTIQIEINQKRNTKKYVGITIKVDANLETNAGTAMKLKKSTVIESEMLKK